MSVSSTASEFSNLLLALSPASRALALQAAVSFRTHQGLANEPQIAAIRTAFIAYWELTQASPVPECALRSLLAPPVPAKTILEFHRFKLAQEESDIVTYMGILIRNLIEAIQIQGIGSQLCLFENGPKLEFENTIPLVSGNITDSLSTLLAEGRKFSTIYADPPWQYQNIASRGAAENHYPTMSVDEICAEPVSRLVDDDAHLHLWTTNGFLREAFTVLEAWGFTFKSCLVWVKNEMGMGNYWRVSHEFLLLGVRGNLTFSDRKQQSWIQAPRTIHSRKPGIVRATIEKVSPGPYLEMYGRERLLDSQWTVYGNAIDTSNKLF